MWAHACVRCAGVCPRARPRLLVVVGLCVCVCVRVCVCACVYVFRYAPGNMAAASIVQVASGRWMGVSPLKYLTDAEEIDIKVAQVRINNTPPRAAHQQPLAR